MTPPPKSDPKSETSAEPSANVRPPRAFDVDDVALVDDVADPVHEPAPATRSHARRPEARPAPLPRPTTADIKRGIRWGGVLMSSIFALATLAAGLWFTRFVSITVARDDWIGWAATGLIALIVLAGAVIIVREIAGVFRLARLERIKRLGTEAAAKPDRLNEAAAIAALKSLYAERHDIAWGIARFKDHERDVLEPGELLRVADREIVAPLDVEARRLILKSAKRVATVTALSPVMFIAIAFVAVETVKMLRALAGIYGGRPGVFGGLRLFRLVVTHILATGGLAMTDDLLGQFFGQDILRRLSRRLGEGAFNGALTARLGVAAIDVLRPLPFLDSPPVRVRDIAGEVFRSIKGGSATAPRP